MDSNELINLFEFPTKTVANQTIFKTDLYDQLNKVKDRQIIQYDINRITLLSIFNESKTNIPGVKDKVEPFSELLFMYIELRTKIKPESAFKTIASTMPYHMVGIVRDVYNQYTIVTGKYELKKNGFLSIKTTNLSRTTEQLNFEKLVKNMRHIELPALDLKIYYQSINEVLNASRIKSLTDIQVEKVDSGLASEIEEQEKNIKKIKIMIKREKQLNRKIPLMQDLEKEKIQLKELLRKLENSGGNYEKVRW